MTGTNHGMTGAVIALLIKEPAVAIPLSFISHFACDAIPHFGMADDEEVPGKKFNTIVALDFVVAVCLMIVFGIIFPSQKWIIWSCMVAAACPDLVWAYYLVYLKKLKKRDVKPDLFTRFHKRIQWSATPKGWFIEIGWFLAMGYIILLRK